MRPRPLVLALTTLLALSACGSAAAESTTDEGRDALDGARSSFTRWLEELRAEAVERGISAATLDAALTPVEPSERVLELDRDQPEFTLTFGQYLDRVINDRRVATGRRRLREHAALLRRVSERYEVQPRFIVALWGVETDYGRRTGGFKVVDALATLAWDGRRAAFFRREMLDALTILDEGHIAPPEMTGSWAGAMGQPQFMPSSFRQYAVDFDGDGRRDIWGTKADVFGSAANYLSSYGWHDDQTWGREVRLPDGFDESLLGGKTLKPIGEWQRLGVRRANGTNLPTRQLEAGLVRPDREGGPVYMVYDNYRTLLRWNRSDYFATSVGILADRIAR